MMFEALPYFDTYDRDGPDGYRWFYIACKNDILNLVLKI
jgi:hypothetical protein